MGRPRKLELDEVLWRSTDLLWARGCDAVSTRDLEDALKLKAPAIYRRFRTKDELVTRCVNFYVDNVIVVRIQRLLDESDDPVDGIQEFFTSTLKPHGKETRLRGCLLANTATHSDGQVPEIHAAIRRGWDLVDAGFQRQILRAQRSGQLASDLDPAGTSQALLMSLQGLLTLVRAGIADLEPGIDATFRLLRGRTTRPD